MGKRKLEKQLGLGSEEPKRPPICSVIGAVDAGKTSLLDLLRGSAVQSGEAGGITQKIGITYLRPETLSDLSKTAKSLDLGGILLVDTPGHDCFTSQRLTGIEISDLVVMVIDIFKGVGKQTIEILKLLQSSKTPFIVAVNKIDRLNKWLPLKMKNLKATLAKQNSTTKDSLDKKLSEIVTQFAEAGMNAAPYYKNPDPRQFISLVPLSSKTGEGVPDLLVVIDQLSRRFLKKQLAWKDEGTTGYIIEHIKDPRMGNCLAIVLLGGALGHDSLMLQTEDGTVIETTVKTLYLPRDDREVKDQLDLQQITVADKPRSYLMKIHSYDTQSNLDILSGSRFYAFPRTKGREGREGREGRDGGTETETRTGTGTETVTGPGPGVEEEEKDKVREECRAQLEKRYSVRRRSQLDKEYQEPGVYISAPTLGAADGLYHLCQKEKIPVASINIGPLTKKTIIRAKLGQSKYPIEFEEDRIWARRYSVVLEFSASKSWQTLLKVAETEGVTILANDVVYRIVEDYQKYTQTLEKQIREQHPNLAPRCQLEFLSEYVFMKKDPILIGVRVLKNKLFPGAILECKKKPGSGTDTGSEVGRTMVLGKVTSIQQNNKSVDSAEPGDEVCIKIESQEEKTKKYEYGRDFDDGVLVRSHYSQKESRLMKKYSHIFQ